jgi:hypothetical protein
MTTEEHLYYIEIEKLVIAKLKQEAKKISTQPINNWAGDGYLTDIQLKKEKERRLKLKKGYTKLLEAFKILNY